MNTIVCDIDCTLYSYGEFIERNFFHPRDTWNALVGNPAPGNRFPGIERTWLHREDCIRERIQRITEICRPHGSVLFLSAFPAEDYKMATFAKLGLSMRSSFPGRKTLYLREHPPEKVLLAIGDRWGDRNISREFQSRLVFVPFYRKLQHRRGGRYTEGLVGEIQRALL